MTNLQTPLYDTHMALGAKMADFGGWDMPIEYSGVVAEHEAVRNAVGVFDVSHMGKLHIHGSGAVDFVNSVVTNDLNKIAAGQAQYSMLCNDEGGVIDDLIVYRESDEDVFIVPNAANASTVAAVFAAAAPSNITVTNAHRDFGILAIQGPQSQRVIEALGLPADHDYMSFRRAQLRGADVIVCRTGYTGEHGYELVVPSAVLVDVWNDVLAAGESVGIAPAGLGARDTLRTEMGYPLHGQDLSPVISPVQARLGWAVGWSKDDFHGATALRAEREAGPSRRLWGIRSHGRAIPRAHMSVSTEHGEGEVTSGTFSPTLRIGIGLALLPNEVKAGDVVTVDLRGKATEFDVVAPPFVDSTTRS